MNGSGETPAIFAVPPSAPMPKGWKTATFWQYTSNPIDQDVFPGKSKALKSLATKKD